MFGANTVFVYLLYKILKAPKVMNGGTFGAFRLIGPLSC